MIIKMQAAGESSGWFFFDNARDVYFQRLDNVRAHFETYLEVTGMAHDSEAVKPYCNAMITDEDMTKGSFFRRQMCDANFNGLEKEGWYLSFVADDVKYEFHGDTEAYLLNDLGRTIEKI